MADITLVKLPKESVGQLFDMMDRNRDAVISMDEMVDTVWAIHPFISEHIEFRSFMRLASDMFIAADTHTNGFLTYLELLQFFTV